jgi:hypothetical protein
MKDFLCKAHSAGINGDYSNYIWSRKLNGFSMLWDGGISIGQPIGQVLWGKERANEDRYTKCTGLWTSDAHIVHAPEWWYIDFPKFIPLQGECWYNDNKTYSSVCNCTLKKSIEDSRWHKLKFVVYNYKPYCLFNGLGEYNFEGNIMFHQHYPNISYSKRLKNIVGTSIIYNISESSIINVIDFYIGFPTSLGELLKEKTIDSNNWEGIMLANPNAHYTCGRSYDLLKLKPEYDIEVEVIGYNQGDKRHTGRMGSLNVRLKWDEKVESFHGGKKDYIGKTVYFSVGGGFDDTQREWSYVHDKFSIGKVINIKFNEVGENGSIPSARWSGENE